MTHFDEITMAVAVAVFIVTQIGCVSVRGGGAAARPAPKASDQICYTRAENDRIEAFKVRCRAKVKELRTKATHDLATARNQRKAKLDACQARLKGCLRQAIIKQKCPSCVRPALVVGLIAGGVGIVVGVVGGVLVTLAIKGDLP